VLQQEAAGNRLGVNLDLLNRESPKTLGQSSTGDATDTSRQVNGSGTT
jgi:hypothetical protein